MGAISLRHVVKRYGVGPKANQVIHGVDAEIAVGADDRLDEHRIELADPARRAPPGKYEVKDQLIVVQVYGAATQAPTAGRTARSRARLAGDVVIEIGAEGLANPLALAQVSPRGSGPVPAQVQTFVGAQ